MLVLRPVFLTANYEIAKVNAVCVELGVIAHSNICSCHSSQENADYNGYDFFFEAWIKMNPMDKIFSVAFLNFSI